MKTTKILLLAVPLILASSCSKDDDCTQADWIGTYTLKSNTDSCEEEDIEIDSEFTITAGSSGTKLRVDGVDYNFTECKITDNTFGIEIELDGNEIKFEAFGCKGTFRRT